MNRKTLREMAVRLFYEMDIHKNFTKEAVEQFIENNLMDTEDDYFQRISDFFINHKAEIDAKIEKSSVSWALNRIAKMDLSILRMGFTEILYMEDIPEKVSINEAVELGKIYGDEKSYRFINGVIGSLLNRSNEQVTDEDKNL